MYKVNKDPQAVLDYGLNWATWLGTDTISSSSWTVPAPLTKDSDSSTSTLASIWLSGGIAGSSYNVTNTIITAAGRTDERSIRVVVKNR